MKTAPNSLLLQTLIAAGATLALVGCDKTPKPSAGTPQAPSSTASVPPKPVADASLPSAASAVGTPASSESTAQDSKATAPMSDSTKADERDQMPKANQANNHSSPSVESSGTGGQTK